MTNISATLILKKCLNFATQMPDRFMKVCGFTRSIFSEPRDAVENNPPSLALQLSNK
jgi:hypothetical protein